MILACQGTILYRKEDLQSQSYYPERSGDITIYSTKQEPSDATILIADNAFNYNMELSGVEEDRIGELLTHLMGTVSLNSAISRKGFPQTNVFDAPKANLFFAVDGVGSDDLKKFSTLKWLGQQKQTPITKKHGSSTVSSLTSMLTSTTPSVHGIVAPKWINDQGAIVTAFVGDNAQALVANVADMFSQTWGIKSFILSGSYSKQYASSMSAHPNGHGYAIAYNARDKQYENIWRVSNSLVLARAGVAPILSTLPAVTVDGNTVTLRFEDSSIQSAQFDLSKEEDFVFLSEVAFVQYVLEQLQSNPTFSSLASDAAPDVLSFAFAGLKQIAGKYGRTSAKFVAALHFLDAYLSSAASTVSVLYYERALTEVVLLGSTVAAVNDPRIKDTVFQNLESHITRDQFEAFYPQIYLDTSSYEVSNVCFDLKKQLAAFDLDAYCPEKSELPTYISSQFRQATNTTTVDAAGFQILLWSSILLALAIASAIYVLCSMDIKKDSLIYRASHHPHST